MRWIAVCGLLAGCAQRPEPLPPQAERGHQVYLANCIACHNADPSKPGPVGPAVMGSSRELIEARVVRAEYPPGYTPKRTTHIMVVMPQVADKVDELAAYLRHEERDALGSTIVTR
jgi:mono/diheme cytochrome c family protein